MRIALLSAEYPPQPGGVGDYTRHLGEALAARDHKVSVITVADCRLVLSEAEGSQIADVSKAQSYLQSTIYNLQSDWGWRCWRDVGTALAAIRPDVLHIQYQTGAYGMHPAINLLPWWLSRWPARPAIVVTMHDLLLPYLFPKAGPLRHWVTRRLMQDADAVVLTNEEDAHEVRRWTMDGRRWITPPEPSSIVRLIPIGSNIPVAPPDGYQRGAWRARLGVRADETLLAYFGLLSRSKGVDTLLDALARLPPSTRLLIVGGAASAPSDRAYAAQIEQQIARLGLHARVMRAGHAAPQDVSAHLLAADLAVLPFTDGASFRRGSLLAALAHGLPVVTTDAQRPTHNLQSATYNLQSSVLLVPPNNPEALSAAISQLASDAALRARLGVAGQALAAQFSWEAIAARHEALYRLCLGDAPEAAR